MCATIKALLDQISAADSGGRLQVQCSVPARWICGEKRVGQRRRWHMRRAEREPKRRSARDGYLIQTYRATHTVPRYGQDLYTRV